MRSISSYLPKVLISSALILLVLMICYPNITKEIVGLTAYDQKTMDKESIISEAARLKIDYRGQKRARLNTRESNTYEMQIGVEEPVSTLGLTIREILPSRETDRNLLTDKSGLLVTKVDSSGIAAKSGVRVNDLLREIDPSGEVSLIKNAQRINTISKLNELLIPAQKSKKQIVLVAKRGQQESLPIFIELGKK